MHSNLNPRDVRSIGAASQIDDVPHLPGSGISRPKPIAAPAARQAPPPRRAAPAAPLSR